MQSGRPAASTGFVAELDAEPAVVELVLLPLIGLVLLPELVLGVSLRTCLVTLSQHFIEPGEAALGEVVVVEVWADAIPTVPANIAAAINPIPVIRMRRVLQVVDEPRRVLAATFGNRGGARPFLFRRVIKKGRPSPAHAQSNDSESHTTVAHAVTESVDFASSASTKPGRVLHSISQPRTEQ